MPWAEVGRSVTVHRRAIVFGGIRATAPCYHGVVVEVLQGGAVLKIRHAKNGSVHAVPRDACTIHRESP